MDGPIDLSAGMVSQPPPAAPPAAPTGTVDLSAGLVPVQKPPRPQPAQDAITASLMDNPKGEGIYHLKGPSGVIQVPYSKIPEAAKQNYFFANKDDLHRYARDYSANPVDESAVDKYLDTAPWWDVPSHVANLLRGAGTGAMQTFTGLDRPPTSSLEQNMQLAAAKPAKTAMESVGDLGENAGEFFSGEELMGLLGKVGNSAEKLKQAQQLSGFLQKSPLVAKLLRIGVTAAKQGGIGGAQTFAKTGGDTGAAATSAGLTAGLSALLGGGSAYVGSKIRGNMATLEDIGGEKVPVTAEAKRTAAEPQQVAGKAIIKNAAQDSAQGHLEELNESRREPASPTALPKQTGPFTFKLRGVKPTESAEGDLLQNPRKKQIGTRVVERTEGPAPQGQPAPVAHGANIRDFNPDTGEGPAIGEPVSTNARRLVKEPTFQYMSGTKPGSPEPRADFATGGGTLETQDPMIARAHASNIDRVISSPSFRSMPPEMQQDLRAAQQEVKQQLSDYHSQVLTQLPGYGKPNFPEVDIPSTVAKVGSYADAAAAVKGHAEDGYKAITDALAFTGESPQHLTMIRQAYQTAEQEFMGATNPKALGQAESKIEAAHEQLRQLIGRVPNTVNLKEFSGLNDAYRNALGLEKISGAIDGSFHGPMSSAKRAWEYSGFNGQELSRNMEQLISTMGRNRVERLMGKENLDAVLQLAQATSTTAGRAKVGIAMKATAQSLMHMHVGPLAAGGYIGHNFLGMSWEGGAAAGWATSMAYNRVKDAILTNPQVAKNLLYAVDYGADPNRYGPFIATMIQKLSTQQSQEEASQ
jgi:hypothetical protein